MKMPLVGQYGNYLSSKPAETWACPIPGECRSRLDVEALALFGRNGRLHFLVLGTLLGTLATGEEAAGGPRPTPLLSLISAFPYFWMAMFLLWILDYHGLGTESGAYDPSIDPGWSLSFGFSAIQHAFLPGLTL